LTGGQNQVGDRVEATPPRPSPGPDTLAAMTDPDALRATLDRMRQIRQDLDESDSPYRQLRIKQADRRIRRLEEELGEDAVDEETSDS
jgi:hypothetical protein